MEVGHFISLFQSEHIKVQIYGAGRAAYHLCKSLAKRGVKIHVFAPSPFKKDLIENYYDNMTVHFYRSFLRVGTMNISFKLLFGTLNHNHNIDVVHVHNDTPISVIAGLRYAKKESRPLVVTWHGDWIENYGSIVRRFGVWFSNKYLVDRVLSCANVIITPSMNYVKESRFLKDHREKLIEIPNGINLEDFNIPYSKEECREKLGLNGAKSIVLFVGALYPLKGPQILLKAIPRIIKEHRDVIFVFVGGGDVDKYMRLSEEMGIQKHVIFSGYVKEGLKLLYYKASDIFVLPSIETFEVFPLVLLEASASRLPIIVSNLSTFRCLVEEGFNGIFAKKGDENSLADAVIYLLENVDVRRRMGENARRKAKDYTWEKTARMTEEVYERVLSNENMLVG